MLSLRVNPLESSEREIYQEDQPRQVYGVQLP